MCFTTKNFKDNKNKIIQYTSTSSFVKRHWKLDYYSKRFKKDNSSGDEIYGEKKTVGYTRTNYKTDIAKEWNITPVLDIMQD